MHLEYRSKQDFAAAYDGDPCACALCADAEASLWHQQDALCSDCYIGRLEVCVQKLAEELAVADDALLAKMGPKP
jgi:hypothetical protein